MCERRHNKQSVFTKQNVCTVIIYLRLAVNPVFEENPVSCPRHTNAGLVLHANWTPQKKWHRYWPPRPRLALPFAHCPDNHFCASISTSASARLWSWTWTHPTLTSTPTRAPMPMRAPTKPSLKLINKRLSSTTSTMTTTLMPILQIQATAPMTRSMLLQEEEMPPPPLTSSEASP